MAAFRRGEVAGGGQLQAAATDAGGGTDKRKEDKAQPERAGGIGHDAEAHVNAIAEGDAVRAHDVLVLEVAGAPAAVPLHEVDEVGGEFLIGAGHVGQEPCFPASAGDEGGFDDVVAQDTAAEGGFAGEFRQAAAFHKGAGAQQGVVAPVVGVGALPEFQPHGGRHEVEAGGELHDTAEECFPPDGNEAGLEQADAGVALHEHDHAAHGLGGHEAVSVEDQHVVVGVAPTDAEFLDVTDFIFGVLFAAAVIDGGAAGVEICDTGAVGFGFRGNRIRVLAVAQDEDVDVGGHVFGLKGSEFRMHGADAGEDLVGVLMIGGNEQGGARGRAGTQGALGNGHGLPFQRHLTAAKQP